MNFKIFFYKKIAFPEVGQKQQESPPEHPAGDREQGDTTGIPCGNKVPYPEYTLTGQRRNFTDA